MKRTAQASNATRAALEFIEKHDAFQSSPYLSCLPSEALTPSIPPWRMAPLALHTLITDIRTLISKIEDDQQDGRLNHVLSLTSLLLVKLQSFFTLQDLGNPLLDQCYKTIWKIRERVCLITRSIIMHEALDVAESCTSPLIFQLCSALHQNPESDSQKVKRGYSFISLNTDL